MNKSFSKIRHIQEANQLLEKRVLKEQDEFDMEDFQETDMDIDGYRDKYEGLMGKVSNLLYDLNEVKGELEDLYHEAIVDIGGDELVSDIDDSIKRIEDVVENF